MKTETETTLPDDINYLLERIEQLADQFELLQKVQNFALDLEQFAAELQAKVAAETAETAETAADEAGDGSSRAPVSAYPPEYSEQEIHALVRLGFERANFPTTEH